MRCMLFFPLVVLCERRLHDTSPIFNINIYCIMGCYYTLYLNNYGYSLLFYKVYHEEGECRQVEFWLEKEQILETYHAQPQKSWNSMEYLKIKKEKSSPKMKARGTTPCLRGLGARPSPLGAPPYLMGPLMALRRPSSPI